MERKLDSIIGSAETIVIVQADNPDGDSLASSLALEHIMGDMGKKPIMYCGVEIPGYLRYLEGWDRVVHALPTQFDASIIVDTTALILLETLQKSGQLSWLSSKPCIVIDHHETKPTISFTSAVYQREATSTGELIYELANKLGWDMNQSAKERVATAILSDTLGLTSESITARSIHIIGELVEAGVSLAVLEDARRSMQKKSPEILAYKGKLLERIKYEYDKQIAAITIPWEEIEKYSHQYNPPMLVLDEMRQVENVVIGIAFKTYPDGRITSKIRANLGFPIAAELAEHFGGGGHPYAAGFKVTDGRSFADVESEFYKTAAKLIDNVKRSNNEAI